MAHSDTVRVVVYVPEADADLVRTGNLASIRVQALDNRSFEGPVTRTASLLDESTRTLRTEIELKNPSGELHPGMYCYVSIMVKMRPDVLVIPLSAVVYDQAQPLCAAIVDGRIVRKPLTLGLRAGNEVEVVSGLNGDDQIVPRTADSYREGQAVQVIK